MQASTIILGFIMIRFEEYCFVAFKGFANFGKLSSACPGKRSRHGYVTTAGMGTSCAFKSQHQGLHKPSSEEGRSGAFLISLFPERGANGSNISAAKSGSPSELRRQIGLWYLGTLSRQRWYNMDS